MPTTQELEAQLASIQKSIASGELTVKYADRQVTYRTLQEMRSIRDELSRQLSGNTGKPRRRYLEFRDESWGSST